MMLSIEKSIDIQAPAAKVWRVFTDPELTKQMGGEYVTDWKVGARFAWKGVDGKMYTNGTIMKIEREKLLQHNLFKPGATGLEVPPCIYSVITYQLREKDGKTTLTAREDFSESIDGEDRDDAVETWDTALGQIKALAEK